MPYHSCSEECQEEDSEGRGHARQPGVDQQVRAVPRPGQVSVVRVVKKPYGPQESNDNQAEIEGDKVSATKESGECVKSEDVDGAVDGQEDEESPGKINVGFPSDGPGEIS